MCSGRHWPAHTLPLCPLLPVTTPEHKPWQAFVVDLFSPHDGSIDLRVLSECFLESDFVENEVSGLLARMCCANK